MPKIRVTMEAEVSDLPSFGPDVPSGATFANVEGVVRDCLISRMEQHTKILVNDPKQRAVIGDVNQDAFIADSEADCTLAERLGKSLKLSIIGD